MVVAPAQTLSNSQHQDLRNIAIKVANHFHIVGECNIQYAVNPANGDYRVIEVNARLSRSSALASKATGYPLAFVAAKLALGWLLHEIPNGITGKTCAYFEPALDYLVVKIPRWDTHKLKSAGRIIGTEMKSVGEVMGIGRSFSEALQKAIGMLNIGASCLSDYRECIDNIPDEIKHPTDRRIFALYGFFLQGGSVDAAHQLSQIDPWFLHQIARISDLELSLRGQKSPPLNDETINFRLYKQHGFSDKVLGQLLNATETDIRKKRLQLGITPVVKQIDTLAGEFAAKTNYLFLTYHGTEHDTVREKDGILVIGSGPYAIGSSVEFDWCAVNTLRTLRKLGHTAIVINSNPETVSTDYDESDRLYFEQLTFERVQDIADIENPDGIVVSVGGQIANSLAMPLAAAGYSLLGTTAANIDRAEDREKFSDLLNHLNIDQPIWQCVTSLEKAKVFARNIGYPVLIRPSYILSGAAMNVAHNESSLEDYLQQASLVSPDHPVVISKFILDAKELEIDGVAKRGEIVIEAISEHIENAGVHSGDATLVLPPQNLYLETIRRAKKITRKIVQALNITGPFNIQFLAKHNHLQVIECNVRASRSFPFVSKVTKHNLIDIATRAMLGLLKKENYETLELDYVGVKAPQFSYQRLKGADPVAQVEMASTGEVACLGDNLLDAFWRAWLASEQTIDHKKILISLPAHYKEKLLGDIILLAQHGWEIYTTEGTHNFLLKNGVHSHCVYKTSEQKEPNIQSLITQRKVDLIINIPNSQQSNNQTDGFKVRRLAIDHHIPLITNAQKAHIMLACLITFKEKSLSVQSWREIVC
ncbi:MAG: carbamoyl-phosphate synthase large subunit [Gammaproteobacteria bacterium]